MFCPGCGIEEKEANQFCRACGTDLRPVRRALESGDAITASAATARDEIGRAVAHKIRETRTAAELAVVAEEVLPEIEKFLESPEEKRMRRVRVGTILSSIGLGAGIGFVIISLLLNEKDLVVIAGLGVVAFFIGLSFIVNGLFLTVPKKTVDDKSSAAEDQRELDTRIDEPDAATNELTLPPARQTFASVTEETTRHLKEKQPARRVKS